ncbi:MAG TPA: hemerythrin family protein [Azospira sp.]|nr:hemerythrin family protein [Azospira sp.]
MDETPHGLLPEELLIGHPDVDDQHEEIFCRIERLKSIVLEDGQPHYAEFDSLFEFFKMHFATEESCARTAGIDFSVHAREHLRNLRILSRALADLHARQLDVRTFLRYLEYWFEQHINDFDKALGHCLDQADGRDKRNLRPAASASLSL